LRCVGGGGFQKIITIFTIKYEGYFENLKKN